MKSKGKRQKAKGKNYGYHLPNLFLPFDFCLLPFDFYSQASEIFHC